MGLLLEVLWYIYNDEQYTVLAMIDSVCLSVRPSHSLVSCHCTPATN